MDKLINIGWKDLRVTFRDPASLIMMLATPFVLTLVMAFAFGTGSSAGGAVLKDIPVIVVNHDTGVAGQALVDSLNSPDLDDLLNPSALKDDAEARARVDDDTAVAAVIIPPGLTASALPSEGPVGAPSQSVIEIYANPTRSVSAGVVRSVVQSVVDRLTAGLVGGQVAITQLIAGGLLSHEEASISGAEIGERASSQTSEQRLISVRSEDADAEEQASASASSGFNWLAFMAPSMAILFLMFTVTAGGRTILAEREGGTLSRMLSTPSRAAQVIGGKVLGIFVVGIAQMTILILASYGLFGVRWGSAAGLVLLTLALVAAATGWGMLLAAYCRTPAQAGQLGAVLSLVFAILGGNLFPRPVMPDWLLTVSYITPNAWGLEGYTKLAAGGGLADIGLLGVGLLTMAAVLFVAATLMFRRQYA